MKPELTKIYTDNVRDFWDLTPAQLMGLTIWAEARGESEAGKIAVASVIIERVNHRTWDGATIHEVCLWPKQFSCFNPGDPQREELVDLAADIKYIMGRRLSECIIIATGILSNKISRDIDIMRSHCCQYLNPETAAKTREKWIAAGMKSIKVIGNHEFFSDGAK